jgi:hypothetical protein
MLGDVVSSPRCPVLRTLAVRHARRVGIFAIQSDSLLEIDLKHLQLGVGILTIHSESLKQLRLANLQPLKQLNVMAPALILLSVTACFISSRLQSVANISAPNLESLGWSDVYHPGSTQFGNIDNLKWLAPLSFHVYANHGHHPNFFSVRLLQRFKLVQSLSFMLLYAMVSSFLFELRHNCEKLESRLWN